MLATFNHRAVSIPMSQADSRNLLIISAILIFFAYNIGSDSGKAEGLGKAKSVILDHCFMTYCPSELTAWATTN